MNFIPNLKYKTEFCHLWLQGTSCQRQYNCFFAHGQHQLRTIEQNQTDMAMKNFTLKMYQQAPENYKTVFCKFYTRGQCKMGDNCTFAHSKKQKKKFIDNQKKLALVDKSVDYQKYLLYSQLQQMNYYQDYINNSLGQIQQQQDQNNPSKKSTKINSYTEGDRQPEIVSRRTKSQQQVDQGITQVSQKLSKLDVISQTEDSKII